MPTVFSSEMTRADREIIGDIWTSESAYENLVTLCDDFGSRFGGTEGERQAAEFMVRKLREYGLDNACLEAFPYNGWIRGSARLEAVQPHAASFDCIALPYCGTAEVEGDLVFLGHGAPEDYEEKRHQIQGNIVMVSTQSPQFARRQMHRMEKYGRALEAGATAFIWMREEPGLLAETGSIKFNAEAEIPGVGVSREVGAALQRMMKKDTVRLRMTTCHVNKPMTSWNVVGELRGHTYPDRFLVIGAHFDGHDISQGALDDGAGAVVAMEAARALAKHKHLLPKSIRFVLFPLEEIGLIGSHAYVDAHMAELKDCEFMLNLDGAGRHGDTALVLQGWSELKGVFRDLSKDMKHPITVGNRISPYSDMYPFVLEGVPAANMMSLGGEPRTGRGWGHTAADTLDKVSPRALQMDALTVARLALRLTNLEVSWPAPHKTRQEIKELLDREELLEVLKYERRYPFDQ
ncbi:MAG: M20/M25/M40 family metallo-hydrolase [Bacillota bacterium]